MTPDLQVASTLKSCEFESVRAAIFGARPPQMQDSGHRALSERELEVVTALQRDPRASWATVGELIGTNATTASRIWQRLEHAGLAWTSVYLANYVNVIGYIWVSVEPGHLEQVATALALHTGIFWMERLDGDAQLFAGFGAPTVHVVETLLTAVEMLPGVRQVRSQLSRRVLQDGAQWLPDTVPPVERSTGHGWQPTHTAPTLPSAREWDAYRVLATNGRTSYIDLARSTGLSERTLRRRLPALLERGLLASRCDVVRESIGLPLGMIVTVDMQRGWQTAASVIARWSATRLVALISGDAPLLLHFWVRSTAHGAELLERISALDPSVRIATVNFSLRSLKRSYRFIGPSGAVTGIAPFGDGTELPEVLS